MPESNTSEPGNDPAELITLRKVRDELLATKHSQKARIEQLESEALQLTEARDRAAAIVHAAVVVQPLKRMVAELSTNVPELVLRELNEDFIFEAGDDGAILVKNKADGKPIAAKDGKPVEWTKFALHQFLIGHGYAEKNERQRLYTHLLGIPLGSGGIGRALPMRGLQSGTPGEKKDDAPNFGLR